MSSTSELAEFLSAITNASDTEAAIREGLRLIAGSCQSDVVAIVRDEQVLGVRARPDVDPPTGHELVEASHGLASTLALGKSSAVAIDAVETGESNCILIVVRASAPLSDRERLETAAMARVLLLAVRLMSKVDDTDRLAIQQKAHKRLLEAILRVQRLISQRQPIDATLQAITTESAFTLGADLAGIHVDGMPNLTKRFLATATSAGRSLGSALSRVELNNLAQRAASSDLTVPALIEVEGPDGEVIDAIVAGSAVMQDGAPIGGLFVACVLEDDTSWRIDRAPIDTFASQAGIALADSSTVDELEHAFHDHLTGLPNRALFHDRFEHALAIGKRRGTTTGLLFMDLDRFKTINDTLGHAAGDAMLREVGAELQRLGRAYDSVARIGGDEFAIVLEDTDTAAALTVAQRVVDALTDVANPVGLPGQLGVSIGIAVSGEGCHTTDELLRRADIALYTVKNSGRAGCAIYDAGMGQTRLNHNALTDTLQDALGRGEFVVHYQPIVDLRTRRVSGVEALVRWQHPEDGLLPPAAFIDAAERTGTIVGLGREVLRIACEQADSWRSSIPDAVDLNISVNVSPRQLQSSDFTADVQATLDATGLDPSALTLEVTESIFVDDAEAMGIRLHTLKDLGVNLAIDDFGTGYSSLSYIHNYPFDVLKIDRAFVKGLGTSANGGAVVRTMLSLAEQLSMSTVAEGIERPAELAQLRALRCSHGQGFMFSRPVEADHLRRLLGRSLTATGANL